jgi:hypothetical protein
MGVVIHLDKGGSGNGWQKSVPTRADLPITLDRPEIGSIYLVEQPTKIGIGILSYTTYQSGLYIRDFNNGNLNDWRRLNVKVKFTDSEFAVVNAADQTKQAKLDLSLITPSTSRTLTVQDKDGTIAYLSDITAGTGNIYNIDGAIPATTVRTVTIPSDSKIDFTDGTKEIISVRGVGQLYSQYGFTFDTVSLNTQTNILGGQIQIDWDFAGSDKTFTISNFNNPQLRYVNNNTTFETILNFIEPTQNNVLNFPNKSGKLAVEGFIEGSLIFENSLTETILANTDNLNVPNIGTTALLRLNVLGNRYITGIIPADNTKSYLLIISNVGTGNLTFRDNNAGSTAENRFLFGGSITVQPNEGLTLVYDDQDQRWRCSGKNV